MDNSFVEMIASLREGQTELDEELPCVSVWPMMSLDRERRGDELTEPSRAPFRAAQHVAALGEGWTKIDASPEGEVIWRENGDQVLLTPTGGWPTSTAARRGCIGSGSGRRRNWCGR